MEADWATGGRAQVEDFRRRHRIGLVTLLFTDIIGSTQLKQTLGDARAATLIQRHHSALREVLRRFSEAEEIDTAGDSFFIVFAKPSDAVKYSLQVEAGLRELARETGATVFDRIGIHVGEVFIDDAPSGTRSRDLFGLQVDTCARIMSLGGAHQILASRFAFDSARQVLKGEDIVGIGPLSWLNHGTYSLKGVDEPIEICEVGEERLAALSPPDDSEKAHRHVAPRDEPVLGWRPAAKQAVPNTKWILERNLGEGGFGEVWLGRHETLKERRVFKFCFDAERVRSLKREVTIFRLLKENIGAHPNIVAIEDVFFDEPPFYIVMEYVQGDNLSGWCEKKGGPAAIPTETRLDIVAQIADALQAAHESGVIHRDVKPQNILIEEANGSPQAKLTDFGIGKVVSQEVLAGMTRLGFTQTLESTGSQSGTQMYMAPEIIAGQPATTRSDIYSLGVVLYQFLIGDFSRPLTTDWEEEVGDPLLRDDLKHCFAREPNKRFAAAKQLGDNLRSFSKRHAVLARRRLLVIGAICLFWVTLVLLLQIAPSLPFVSIVWSAEKQFDDFLQRVGSKTPTRDDFVFLGIDERTLEIPPLEPNEFVNNRALQLMTEHPFPWSREVWALLLDRLFASGARLVLFDLIFNPTRDGDPAFRAALDRYRGKVVVGANFDSDNAMQAIVPNASLIPPSQMADPRVGYVNLFPDIDPSIRSIHLPGGYTISKENPPSSTTRSIRYTLTDGQLAGQEPNPSEKVFRSLSARGLEQLGRGVDVPLDHDAQSIRFSANDAYLPRPLYEVFDGKLWHTSYRDGAFFKDKVIIVGVSAQIMHDVVETPLGPSRSGPKLHLEAMAAAMAHQFLRVTPLWVDYLLVVAAGLLACTLIGFVRHRLIAFLLLLGVPVVYLAVVLIVYDWFGLLLITVPVLTVFLLSGLVSLGYDYRVGRIEKLRTRRPPKDLGFEKTWSRNR